MNLDIMNRNSFTFLGLALVAGIITYFYVLHIGKKEGKTINAKVRFFLVPDVFIFAGIYFITVPNALAYVFGVVGYESALLHNFIILISYSLGIYNLLHRQAYLGCFTMSELLGKKQ